jgi:hypothetical protein
MSGQALEPDRNQIDIFVDAIFRHAKKGFISLRAFYEGEDKSFRISLVPVIAGNFKFLCDVVEDDARRAAQYPKAVVFCPPLATFSNKDKAREEDIAEGLTLSVECDENPDAAGDARTSARTRHRRSALGRPMAEQRRQLCQATSALEASRAGAE